MLVEFDQAALEAEDRVVIKTVDADIARRGRRKAARVARTVDADGFSADAEAERVLGLRDCIIFGPALRRRLASAA